MTSLSSSAPSRFQAAFAACLLLTGMVGFSASSYATSGDFSMTTPTSVPTAMVGGGSPSYQANVESRLADMERQLRDMTGKVERVEFENAQLKTKLEKSLTDIDLRFQDVQAAGSKPAEPDMGMATDAEVTPSPKKQTGTLAPDDMGGDVMGDASADTSNPKNVNDPASQDSPTVKKLGEMTESPEGAKIKPELDKDAAAQYETAFAQLKGGNFVLARGGFESFIKKNPTHPLVSNATYWLGESYYADGEFEKAARIFAESYKKYPKGPKVADSLLKMGMSLGGAGKTKEACVTLGQLKKQFGNEEGVTIRRADQEMKRIGCQ